MTSARIIVATVLLAACPRAPVAPPGIHFPTHDAGGTQQTGLFDGTLEVEDGCVYLAQHGERWLGLWPDNVRAELDGDRLRIVDEDGQVLAREGGADPSGRWGAASL